MRDSPWDQGFRGRGTHPPQGYRGRGLSRGTPPRISQNVANRYSNPVFLIFLARGFVFFKVFFTHYSMLEIFSQLNFIILQLFYSWKTSTFGKQTKMNKKTCFSKKLSHNQALNSSLKWHILTFSALFGKKDQHRFLSIFKENTFFFKSFLFSLIFYYIFLYTPFSNP